MNIELWGFESQNEAIIPGFFQTAPATSPSLGNWGGELSIEEAYTPIRSTDLGDAPAASGSSPTTNLSDPRPTDGYSNDTRAVVAYNYTRPGEILHARAGVGAGLQVTHMQFENLVTGFTYTAGRPTGITREPGGQMTAIGPVAQARVALGINALGWLPTPPTTTVNIAAVAQGNVFVGAPTSQTAPGATPHRADVYLRAQGSLGVEIAASVPLNERLRLLATIGGNFFTANVDNFAPVAVLGFSPYAMLSFQAPSLVTPTRDEEPATEPSRPAPRPAAPSPQPAPSAQPATDIPIFGASK